MKLEDGLKAYLKAYQISITVIFRGLKMATKPKIKSTRAPTTVGKNAYANFNAKSDAANKLMDKAFKDGKPKPGTSVVSRVANKAAAWNKYEEATKQLKDERKAKEAGKKMASTQKAAKATRPR